MEDHDNFGNDDNDQHQEEEDPYEDAEIPDNAIVQIYINVISRILDQMIANSPLQLDQRNLTVFDSHEIPNITMQNYLTRIMTYARTSSRSLIMSLSYIDIIVNERANNMTVTRHNVHRLMLVSLMIASKFYNDIYYDNKTWSRIGGVSLEEINRLEHNFLRLMEYRVHIHVDRFINYVQLFLSYADNNSLYQTNLLRAVLRTIMEAITEEIADSIFD